MNKESSFVLADTSKCSGCRACEVACFANHTGAKQVPKTVGNITTPLIPNLYLTRLPELCMPVQCHHCEDAPCIESCLTGALSRVEGSVVINKSKCIGCKNCVMACPFGAAQVVSVPGAASIYKCDLCINAKSPACVAACPNEALRLVDTQAELKEKRARSAEALNIMMNAAVPPAKEEASA